MMAISQANATGEVDPERQQRALQDPEVQVRVSHPVLEPSLAAEAIWIIVF